MSHDAIAKAVKLTRFGVYRVCSILELCGLITVTQSKPGLPAIMHITSDGSNLLASLSFSERRIPSLPTEHSR